MIGGQNLNSIKNNLAIFFYNLLFVFNLKKIIKLYSKEVIEKFDFVNSDISYWIECEEEYEFLPQKVDDEKECNGSLRTQIELSLKSWRFFRGPATNDFRGLLKCILWFRNYYINEKQYDIIQTKVSEHIYEM